MSRQRRPSRSPRVGAHVDDEFLGDSPVERPAGLDPFEDKDLSAEGEAALELLPRMSRTTGSYREVKHPKPYRQWAIAVIAAAAVIAGGLLILANR